MLGKSIPNGNGRLALTAVDVLLQRLNALGVISDDDLAALLGEVETRLSSEHSIASEGALSVLRTSKLGA